jgi:hypothetical protein
LGLAEVVAEGPGHLRTGTQFFPVFAAARWELVGTATSTSRSGPRAPDGWFSRAHLSQSVVRADKERIDVGIIDHSPFCGDQGELAVPVTGWLELEAGDSWASSGGFGKARSQSSAAAACRGNEIQNAEPKLDSKLPNPVTSKM